MAKHARDVIRAQRVRVQARVEAHRGRKGVYVDREGVHATCRCDCWCIPGRQHAARKEAAALEHQFRCAFAGGGDVEAREVELDEASMDALVGTEEG